MTHLLWTVLMICACTYFAWAVWYECFRKEPEKTQHEKDCEMVMRWMKEKERE